MEPPRFDEVECFRAIADSGAPTLLIGRRALVLGLPVLTADYDFWLATDDVTVFNAVGASFGLHPSRTPDEARRRGRYISRTTSTWMSWSHAPFRPSKAW